VYDDAIQYQVILTVEDSRGNQDSELGEIRVTESESVADDDSSDTGNANSQTENNADSTADDSTGGESTDSDSSNTTE